MLIAKSHDESSFPPTCLLLDPAAVGGSQILRVSIVYPCSSTKLVSLFKCLIDLFIRAEGGLFHQRSVQFASCDHLLDYTFRRFL